MVSLAQHWRHFLPFKFEGASKVRAVEEAILKRILFDCVGVAYHAGNKSADSVDEDDGCNAAIRQDIIADTDLFIDVRFYHPFVDPFVMATEQDQMLFLGQFFALAGAEQGPLRRQINHMRFLCPYALDRLRNRLWT